MLTFNCTQDSKTGCKFIKKVYDKSSEVRCRSQRKEESPSGPTDGHDINISDSMRGQEVVVANKQSSFSWLSMSKQCVRLNKKGERDGRGRKDGKGEGQRGGGKMRKYSDVKYLQKEASREVRRGQLIDASDNTPHPFSSSNTICGASIRSELSLGHIPKFRL